MNDPLLMPVIHGVTHEREQLQALTQVQLVLLDILGDEPSTMNVFHREIRHGFGSILVGTGLEDLRDPRVTQTGEDLRLEREPAEGGAGGDAVPEHFQCDTPVGMQTVTLNGKGEMMGLEIDPSMFSEDDKEVLARMLEIFEQDAADRMLKIGQAIEAGDHATLNSEAHALKGGLGNFFATDSFETAYQLEVMGSQGNTAGAAPMLEKLQGETIRLRIHLRNAALYAFQVVSR